MTTPNNVLLNQYFKTVHEEFDEVYDQLSTQIHPNNNSYNISSDAAIPTNILPIASLETWQLEPEFSTSNPLNFSSALHLTQDHQTISTQPTISPGPRTASDSKIFLHQSSIETSHHQNITNTIPVRNEAINQYQCDNGIASTGENISGDIDYGTNFGKHPVTKQNQQEQNFSRHSLHENSHKEEAYPSNTPARSKATDLIDVFNNDQQKSQNFQSSFTHSVVYEQQELDQVVTPEVPHLIPIASQTELSNVNSIPSTQSSLWTPTTSVNSSGPNCSTHDHITSLRTQLDAKFTIEHLKSIKLDKWDSVCKICNTKLANYCDFVEHFDRHQLSRNTRRYHKCVVPICPMSVIGFQKKSSLRHHTHEYHFYRGYIVDEFRQWESPLRQLLYTCLHPGCAKAFYRRDSLTRHTRLLHENPRSVFNKRLAVRIRKDLKKRKKQEHSPTLESP